MTIPPIPPLPDGAKAVPDLCPRCGVAALHIEARLTAKPLGTYSNAGAQLKIVAEETVHLVCHYCGAEVRGDIEPDGRHGLFDTRIMKRPDGPEEKHKMSTE